MNEVSALKDSLKNYKPGLFGPNRVINSAVILPLIKIEGEYHILFELRSHKLRTQPGEVSFPGGKIERGENPKSAAVREFCEEVCTSECSIEVIGEIDTYFAPARGLIHCFVAIVDSSINIDIKNDEVDELFTVPVKFFVENNPEIYLNSVDIRPSENFPFEDLGIKNSYKFSSATYELIYYKYKEYTIWGITASLVKNFINKFCK